MVSCSARVAATQKKNLLATLRLQLDSGLALMSSLNQQAKLSDDPACQAACAALAENIESGRTFAEAAAGCPGLFNSFEVAAIDDGERTGRLPETLRVLEADLEWRTKVRSQVISAIIYPAVILNVGYIAFNLQNILLGHWFVFFVGWIVFNLVLYTVWALCTRGRSLGSVRGAIDTVALVLPPLRWMVGDALLSHQKSLYFGALARSIATGASVAASIERAADQLGSPPIRIDFRKPAYAIAAGSSVAEGFDQSEYLEAAERALISSGETGAQLPTIFDSIARRSREDFENWLHVFSRVFPLALYLLAVVYVVSKIL